MTISRSTCATGCKRSSIVLRGVFADFWISLKQPFILNHTRTFTPCFRSDDLGASRMSGPLAWHKSVTKENSCSHLLTLRAFSTNEHIKSMQYTGEIYILLKASSFLVNRLLWEPFLIFVIQDLATKSNTFEFNSLPTKIEHSVIRHSSLMPRRWYAATRIWTRHQPSLQEVWSYNGVL